MLVGDPGTPPVRGKGEARLVDLIGCLMSPFLPVRADVGLPERMTPMPTDCLPDNPNLEQLKAHAKVLRDLVRAGVAGSVDLVREHHPRFADLAVGTAAATSFKLADAQLTMARHYDFASWAKLRQYVEEVNRLSRAPHRQPVGGTLADEATRADELLRQACLNYGADDPARWARADELLAEHPHLAG